MNFEISEKFNTNTTQDEIIQILAEQFTKVAENVNVEGNGVIVDSIEASFGSINRSDTTEVILREKNNGVLCIADVNYKPSVMFWILGIILLFSSGIMWVLPVGFYLYQKKTVTEAIENVLKRVKDEVDGFEQTNNKPVHNQQHKKEPVKELDYLEQLEKLSKLKEKGVITEEEFKHEKEKII